MKRLDRLSERLRHRVHDPSQYVSVACDCGGEFAARKGAVARCPACGRTDGREPAVYELGAFDRKLARAVHEINRRPESGLTELADAAIPLEQSMSSEHIRGLRITLKDIKDTIGAAAKSLADKAQAAHGEFKDAVDLVHADIEEIKSATRELRGDLVTNGGPPLDDSEKSAPRSTGS